MSCIVCMWLQGLSELQRADLAIGDVKLGNAIVDPSKLRGGLGPVAKLIDYGFSTHGTACLPCSQVWFDRGRGGACKGGKGLPDNA